MFFTIPIIAAFVVLFAAFIITFFFPKSYACKSNDSGDGCLTHDCDAYDQCYEDDCPHCYSGNVDEDGTYHYSAVNSVDEVESDCTCYASYADNQLLDVYLCDVCEEARWDDEPCDCSTVFGPNGFFTTHARGQHVDCTG